MADLIDRQAAIDAFDMLLIDITGRQNAERVVEYLQTVIQRIKDLPSAQPDKDALEDAYAHGYTAAESEFRKRMDAQQEPQWIPCSERLPEENTPVLLGVRFKDDFKYFVTVRTDYNYWHGLGRDIRGEMRWCRLPEPWRGEEHEQSRE